MSVYRKPGAPLRHEVDTWRWRVTRTQAELTLVVLWSALQLAALW